MLCHAYGATKGNDGASTTTNAGAGVETTTSHSISIHIHIHKNFDDCYGRLCLYSIGNQCYRDGLAKTVGHPWMRTLDKVAAIITVLFILPVQVQDQSAER